MQLLVGCINGLGSEGLVGLLEYSLDSLHDAYYERSRFVVGLSGSLESFGLSQHTPSTLTNPTLVYCPTNPTNPTNPENPDTPKNPKNPNNLIFLTPLLNPLTRDQNNLLTCCIILSQDGYTKDSGATYIVPGSHNLRRFPEKKAIANVGTLADQSLQNKAT